MTDTLQKQLQHRIEGFAVEITEIVQRAISESILHWITPGAKKPASAPSASPSKGTKKKAASKKAPAKKAKAAKVTAVKTPKSTKAAPKAAKAVSVQKGAKRNAADLERVEGALLAELNRQGERSIENLAKTLKLRTKDLNLPMARLLSTKKVRKTGQRRATRYFLS